MNWYYVDSGQQTGPVDDTRMQELVRTGKIQPETLVWQEGMAAWQPYQEVTRPGLRLATAAATVQQTSKVMPKGRNFH